MLFPLIMVSKWYNGVCDHQVFQTTGHQPGVVANAACSQLNREKKKFRQVRTEVFEIDRIVLSLFGSE